MQDLGVDYARPVGERQRLRLIALITERRTESVRVNAHAHEQLDVFGGAFDEYLWQANSVTFAYDFGEPTIDNVALNHRDGYRLDDYRDRIFAACRSPLADNAQNRMALRPEASARSCSGSVQFMLFFPVLP